MTGTSLFYPEYRYYVASTETSMIFNDRREDLFTFGPCFEEIPSAFGFLNTSASVRIAYIRPLCFVTLRGVWLTPSMVSGASYFDLSRFCWCRQSRDHAEFIALNAAECMQRGEKSA